MPTRIEEQAERKAMIQQDIASHRIQQSLLRTPNQRQPDNAKAYSQLPVDQPEGRFNLAMKQAALSGSKPTVDALAAPNWAAQAAGIEPPLDIDVNWTPAVGEAFEVEEAARILELQKIELEDAQVSVGKSPSDVEASHEPEQIAPSAAPAHPLRRRKL